MANSEHLAKIKEGVEAWNAWRKAHPEIVPDLREASLTGANLREAYLRRADLSRANLGGANLARANLHRANLSRANLSRANLTDTDLTTTDLRWADLSRANLSRTNLYEADLSGADLRAAELREASLIGANLSRANLTGAYLTKASIGYTTSGDNDLSNVKDLETVSHKGPSTIGIDTIYRSQGKIPLAFLRGAGVPENFIAHMGSLNGKALEFYSCFISYSTNDQEFADRLHADLQNKGVRCWFAPHDLRIGDRFQEVIERSIRVYEKLLIILSESSVNSDWVEREVQAAIEKERRSPGDTVLLPIRLDDAVMRSSRAWAAGIQETRHVGDFRKWKDRDSLKSAFERLLRDLGTEGSKAA
ncbi:MAG: toll/interleukin-1 receptor domain-containing protein [Terriglobales bacterium]|jgi:hypothetical protein